MEPDADSGRPQAPGRLFVSTLWSVVLRAGSGTEDESRQALERLCTQYWRPLFVFARSRGHGEHDAQDLTQGFLAGLLEKNGFARADRARGRFRTFLLSSFCHYLANQQRDQSALKRGGGQPASSLDDEAGKAAQLSDGLTPERLYERSWAFALLERTVDRLRAEYASAGRHRLFEAIQPHLAGPAERRGYAELGRVLGVSESTVAVAVHRLRRRYGEILREEISDTVNGPEEAEDELRHLLHVVSDNA